MLLWLRTWIQVTAKLPWTEREFAGLINLFSLIVQETPIKTRPLFLIKMLPQGLRGLLPVPGSPTCLAMSASRSLKGSSWHSGVQKSRRCFVLEWRFKVHAAPVKWSRKVELKSWRNQGYQPPIWQKCQMRERNCKCGIRDTWDDLKAKRKLFLLEIVQKLMTENGFETLFWRYVWEIQQPKC